MAKIRDPNGDGSNPNLNDLAFKQKGFFIEWFDPGSDDTIYGLGGNDVITVHNGNDTVWGGYGDDVIVDGGNGDDELFGEEGNDTFVAGTGHNEIDGGPGQDAVSYEASPVGAAVDLQFLSYGYASGYDVLTNIENVHGSAYLDTLRGNDLANYLNGHAGYDTLEGRGGDDFLEGGTGRDTLDGGSGNDTLYGGLDWDTLTGGPGADRFLFTSTSESVIDHVPGHGEDRIMDFNSGQQDRIDVSEIDAWTDIPLNNSFTFVGLASWGSLQSGEIGYSTGGGNTLIFANTDLDPGPELTITLVGNYSLTSFSFIL